MIRRFDEEDLERVMRIWLEGNLAAHGFIPRSYWIEHAPEVRELLPQATVFVHENEAGDVDGFIGLDGSYVAGLFVDRNARSHGVGRQLLEHAKREAANLTLHVYARNEHAVAFYMREGFVTVATGFDKDTGEPELTMAWSR